MKKIMTMTMTKSKILIRTRLILTFLVYPFVFFTGTLLLSSCARSDEREKTFNQPYELSLTGLLAKYREDPKVCNIVVVKCEEAHLASLLIYHKNPQCNAWSLIGETKANIGTNGCTLHKEEGDGKTPLGDFGIVTAFGILPSPKTQLPYIQVTPSVYAVDTEHRLYNKIVNATCSGDREGEHMYEFSPRYNYGIALDYNHKGVKDKGSNIFLRCKEESGPTPGGIAVEEEIVLNLIETISPNDRICIIP